MALRRSHRRRALLRGAGLLLLLVAAVAGIALLARPASPAVALEPGRRRVRYGA